MVLNQLQGTLDCWSTGAASAKQFEQFYNPHPASFGGADEGLIDLMQQQIRLIPSARLLDPGQASTAPAESGSGAGVRRTPTEEGGNRSEWDA